MKSILSAAILYLLAPPSQAAELYDCKMNVTENNHVISEWILIQHDTKTGDAIVIDAFIKHYVGEPVAARVLADNANRVTFGWTLKDIKPTTGRIITRAEFKLTYTKASKQAHATSSVPLYELNESGFGTCVIKTVKD